MAVKGYCVVTLICISLITDDFIFLMFIYFERERERERERESVSEGRAQKERR